MPNLPAHLKTIHEKALTLSAAYKKCEADLLGVICEARDQKIYRYFECTSIYEYCVKILGLDAGVVYGFTAVAKKIKEVPELQTKIAAGELNVSTAKRITSVLTPENKTEWFEKAATLPVRKLEKEVARVNPKAETANRVSYLNSKRVKMVQGLSEKLMLKIRRIQDLECQRLGKFIGLEEVIEAMADNYLTKHDPVEKAKRAEIRGSHHLSKTTKSESSLALAKSNCTPTKTNERPMPTQSDAIPSTWKRTPIPAAILHKVHLRDQGRCRHFNPHTKHQCQNRRFIEVHHKIPLFKGGTHNLENLVMLCSEHHRQEHSRC